jgi:hypothetical protein
MNQALQTNSNERNQDIKKFYVNLLESSSAYYVAKRTARKDWINGDRKGMEDARTKFSHFLHQIDYQTQHFLNGQKMAMSGLHQ